MIGARHGAPLAIGYGEARKYLGSDALALAPFTDEVAYLDDGDWAILTRKSVDIRDEAGKRCTGPATRSPPARSSPTRAITAISWRRRSTNSRKWSDGPSPIM